MKDLCLSFADPKRWRNNAPDYTRKVTWKRIRRNILMRDDYSCQYCDFRAPSWQIVHHMDGNPNNNSHDNLETICPICNMIMHAGQGCVLQEIVDLYRKSKFDQVRINQITRRLRVDGKNDAEIITFLGLKEQASFDMDRKYLRGLFGFVSSRRAKQDWTNSSLDYGYRYQQKLNRTYKSEYQSLAY